jgi:molybdenum cofactor cytidylyltransferase
VAGLTGLGKPLTKNWVHRPEIFAELSGLSIGEIVTVGALVNVLRHHDGGLKNIPPIAHRVMLLNQADNEELQSQGRAITDQLFCNYHSCIIASLVKKNKTTEIDKNRDIRSGIYAIIEQVAGIVLAAGNASRFGKPKQLLHWKGQPLIRHVVIAALTAGLSPVVVVVGDATNEIGSVIADLPVRIAINTEWMTGLSSSIRTGIEALPNELGGAIFLHADQPQISHLLIKSLVEAHQLSLEPIIAPQINGQRGNPVLFDRKTFPDLLSLKEDKGGKALFSQYPIQWVTWYDPNQLIDIDTPEDYQKFLEIYPENER